MAKLRWLCPYPKTAHLTAGAALDEAKRLNVNAQPGRGKSYVWTCPHGPVKHWHCGRREWLVPLEERVKRLAKKLGGRLRT